MSRGDADRGGVADRLREAVVPRVTAGAFVFGWSCVKLLPESVARGLFRWVADLAWWRSGPGVRRLEANLRRVVGPAVDPDELRSLSRAAMRSYLRYWMEVFRLPIWGSTRVLGTFRLDNEAALREPLAAGRGVLVVLPHSANWDHAGAWCVLTGAPLTTVAERLRPESLFDRFVAYRRSLGMEVLPLGEPNLVGTLARRLREGRLVCLLGDRDLSERGVPVTFFGERVSMPGGPATLALHTGAVLLPATLWYDGEGLRGRLHPRIVPPEGGSRAEKVVAMTQAVADAFAEGIAAHPADWHMLQRLWHADRPA